MADPGSIAERVKQQADIVRVVGEYVRLKKSGQNFVGLCPFHSEKTPSFAVHPAKQIYHCFGCGAGGDVFRFVMEVDKISFPEAVRAVAEKCGIPLPAWGGRGGPQSAQATEQRRALLQMQKEAAAFFTRQLETGEGRVARGYLEDRGLARETIARFGLGWAPSGGEALARHLRSRFPAALLDPSGLVSRDRSGHAFDRFRRRVMFPIATETGQVVAFGGRSLGDEMPKYLNSPETRIYTKSRVLYNLDRAREAIRREGFAVLVEGYMDAIALAEAGIENVVASCGTSLAATQMGLLARFTRKLVMSLDADTAGQAAAKRSLRPLLDEFFRQTGNRNPYSVGVSQARALPDLLEKGFEVRVLTLPSARGEKTDPDQFVRREGAQAFRELLGRAPLYLDYVIEQVRPFALSSAEAKVEAVNFLLPYLQLLPNGLARSEWASHIAAGLRVDQPVLRQALAQAAVERRPEVKPRPELLARNGLAAPATPAERRLLKMLLDAEALRPRLAEEIRRSGLHQGLETEKLFAALLDAGAGGRWTAEALTALGERLEERDRRLLFELAFESGAEASWEEAESCLEALERRGLESELRSVQAEIETLKGERGEEGDRKARLLRLLERKQTLRSRIFGTLDRPER